ADADESAAAAPGNAAPSTAGPLAALIGFLIPSAHAQSANIDIETPQVNAIKQRMAERHRNELSGWFDAGAIGLDNSGLVQIRDRAAIGLAERRRLESVVAEENADRRAVYREIAVANGHPEWEDQIRETFARRWIANARPGWYYQDDGGNWVRK
ncbi:MAG: YdbL family protein, partial [Wenzhouxiangellaceae bacterium]